MIHSIECDRAHCISEKSKFLRIYKASVEARNNLKGMEINNPEGLGTAKQYYKLFL